jgi:hypothetical protein
MIRPPVAGDHFVTGSLSILLLAVAAFTALAQFFHASDRRAIHAADEFVFTMVQTIGFLFDRFHGSTSL